MKIINTSTAFVINPPEEARTGDYLHGCFISSIIYSSGLALMAHYGPHSSFGKIHLKKIKSLHEQIQQDQVKHVFLCTRNLNFYYDMVMPLADYEKERTIFTKQLESLVCCPVESKTYLAGNIIHLTIERELIISSY